jgi:hypothetical protein
MGETKRRSRECPSFIEIMIENLLLGVMIVDRRR